MKDFISEIKKIPTDGLIYCLSEKSIDMFRKNECLMPVTIPVIHNGQRKILTVTLTAWDILDMEFLSIKESKQRFTRGYKRYKETSGLIEWKKYQIFHSIFT